MVEIGHTFVEASYGQESHILELLAPFLRIHLSYSAWAVYALT